jgi:hypothetical protein
MLRAREVKMLQDQIQGQKHMNESGVGWDDDTKGLVRHSCKQIQATPGQLNSPGN